MLLRIRRSELDATDRGANATKCSITGIVCCGEDFCVMMLPWEVIAIGRRCFNANAS
jgi:hypothetical protein